MKIQHRNVIWALLFLFTLNQLVFAIVLQSVSGTFPIAEIIMQILFALPILLSLLSIKAHRFHRHFSLYPAYLLGTAHLLVLFLWCITVVLTLGISFVIQLITFTEALFYHPAPVLLIFLQGFLWTVVAPPLLTASIMQSPLSLKAKLLAPLQQLALAKRIIFVFLCLLYAVFLSFYYAGNLYNYGFMPFLGPPS